MPRNKTNPTPNIPQQVTTIERKLFKIIEAIDQSLIELGIVSKIVHELAWSLNKLQVAQKELDDSGFIQKFMSDASIVRMPPQIVALQILNKTYLSYFNALYKILDDRIKRKAKEKKEAIPDNPLDAFAKEFAA